MDTAALAQMVKESALALGFDGCGIAPATPSAFRHEFREWIARGHHGEMEWLARDPERRLDPARVMPEARSIVAVTLGCDAPLPPPGPGQAIFARYAANADYHDVMATRLRQLLEFVQEREPAAEGRVYVDTGPLLEREVAHRAGLGWFGKNTMLIDTRRGSHFLLGELLLNVPLPPDTPAVGQCGTCTRCIDACPTGAIVRPYELDARRCISYLTIESRGPIPQEQARDMGPRVFGCDICQEVCPFNVRRSEPARDPAFTPRPATANVRVTDLLALTEDAFRDAYRGSPVRRAKRRGLLRNAAAALSSRDDPQAVRALERALHDPEPLVREQAAQSLRAIHGRACDRP